MNIAFILYLVVSGIMLATVFNSQWGRVVPRKVKGLLILAVILGAVVDFFIWGGASYSNGFNINAFN